MKVMVPSAPWAAASHLCPALVLALASVVQTPARFLPLLLPPKVTESAWTRLPRTANSKHREEEMADVTELLHLPQRHWLVGSSPAMRASANAACCGCGPARLASFLSFLCGMLPRP